MISKTDRNMNVPKRKIYRYSNEKILEIVKKVSENYSYGEYTLESVCENSGVPIRTWRDWWTRYYANKDNPEHKWNFLAEVAELWEDSQRIRRETSKMIHMEVAKDMLIKRMKGWEYVETQKFYKCMKDGDGQDIVVLDRLITRTKLVPPNARLIQFVLESLNPSLFRNNIIIEKPTIEMKYYKDRTLQEIQAEIEKLGKDSH